MDQPGQRLGIKSPADPKPVPTCKINLDLPFSCIAPRRFMTGMVDNLDRQETGCLRRRWRRPWRKPWITHPFEDKIGIQPIAPRDLRNRYIRCRRLKTDRRLALRSNRWRLRLTSSSDELWLILGDAA